MSSLSINQVCGTCKHFTCIRGETSCPRCAQRCHDTTTNDKSTYLCIVDDRGSKFSTIKQTFLSRWYGHGGCSARVEQVVAIFNPAVSANYVNYQQNWITAKEKERTEGSEEPFMNERRLYIPFSPTYTCENFLPPATQTSTSGGGIPSTAWQPQQPPQPLQNLTNKPVKPCNDTQCQLCQWIQHGVPQTPEGRTGNSGTAHYLSYEPNTTKVGDPMSSAGGASSNTNGKSAPDQSVAPKQESASDVAKQRKIFVLCRALIGNTQWLGDSDSTLTGPTKPGMDSLLVEKGGVADVVLHNSAAMVPIYLIVCSSER